MVATKAGYISSFLGVRASSSSPLQRVAQAGQHVRQAPLASPARIRLLNTWAEHCRVLGHCLGQGLPALDAFDQAGDHFAKARIFDRIAQIGQAVEDGHASPAQLFEVEAEVDQLRPRHGAGRTGSCAGPGGR